MKIAWIALALIFPFACTAQEPCNGSPLSGEQWRYKEPVYGKVKFIRSSAMSSSNAADLRTAAPPDTYPYWVDSFSNTGHMSGISFMINGVVTERQEIRWDAKGNITEVQWRGEKAGMAARSAFTYDTAGNLTQQSIYGMEGQLCQCIKYTYADRRLATEEDSVANGLERTVYRYSDMGTRIGAIIDLRGCGTAKYFYDDKGNKVSATFSRSDSRDLKLVYRYDEHNNRVMEEGYDPDGNLILSDATDYIYDRYGNWIRRIEEIPNNEPPIFTLTVREIGYY